MRKFRLQLSHVVMYFILGLSYLPYAIVQRYFDYPEQAFGNLIMMDDYLRCLSRPNDPNFESYAPFEFWREFQTVGFFLGLLYQNLLPKGVLFAVAVEIKYNTPQGPVSYVNALVPGIKVGEQLVVFVIQKFLNNPLAIQEIKIHENQPGSFFKEAARIFNLDSMSNDNLTSLARFLGVWISGNLRSSNSCAQVPKPWFSFIRNSSCMFVGAVSRNVMKTLTGFLWHLKVPRLPRFSSRAKRLRHCADSVPAGSDKQIFTWLVNLAKRVVKGINTKSMPYQICDAYVTMAMLSQFLIMFQTEIDESGAFDNCKSAIERLLRTPDTFLATLLITLRKTKNLELLPQKAHAFFVKVLFSGLVNYFTNNFSCDRELQHKKDEGFQFDGPADVKTFEVVRASARDLFGKRIDVSSNTLVIYSSPQSIYESVCSSRKNAKNLQKYLRYFIPDRVLKTDPHKELKKHLIALFVANGDLLPAFFEPENFEGHENFRKAIDTNVYFFWLHVEDNEGRFENCLKLSIVDDAFILLFKSASYDGNRITINLRGEGDSQDAPAYNFSVETCDFSGRK